MLLFLLVLTLLQEMLGIWSEVDFFSDTYVIEIIGTCAVFSFFGAILMYFGPFS
jgi:hypothetical protein